MNEDMKCYQVPEGYVLISEEFLKRLVGEDCFRQLGEVCSYPNNRNTENSTNVGSVWRS